MVSRAASGYAAKAHASGLGRSDWQANLAESSPFSGCLDNILQRYFWRTLDFKLENFSEESRMFSLTNWIFLFSFLLVRLEIRIYPFADRYYVDRRLPRFGPAKNER
jgi:hypothetical protein